MKRKKKEKKKKKIGYESLYQVKDASVDNITAFSFYKNHLICFSLSLAQNSQSICQNIESLTLGWATHTELWLFKTNHVPITNYGFLIWPNKTGFIFHNYINRYEIMNSDLWLSFVYQIAGRGLLALHVLWVHSRDVCDDWPAFNTPAAVTSGLCYSPWPHADFTRVFERKTMGNSTREKKN